MRLNIAAGTAVRFEPGDTREVELVALGGTREVVGPERPGRRARSTIRRARARRCGGRRFARPADSRRSVVETRPSTSHDMKLDRRTYADHYGPTTGDRIRLADTDLIIRDRARLHDLRRRGEVRRRQGHPRRHGAVADGDAGPTARPISSSPTPSSSTAPASTRPTSAFATAASRRSARPGNSGRDGRRHAGLEIGASTEILAGEGHILTAGGIDSHVHFISPNQIPDAFHSGITTLIGGGTGPATGTNATTCTPGAWNIRRMYEAVAGVSAELRLSRQGQRLEPGAAARADSRRRASASSCTRTGARRRPPSISASPSPTSSTSRSRFTPTR